MTKYFSESVMYLCADYVRRSPPCDHNILDMLGMRLKQYAQSYILTKLTQNIIHVGMMMLHKHVFYYSSA